ncbi:MAG: FadR/GntR family transcriptional regulator [Chloroflexota bacterium]
MALAREAHREDGLRLHENVIARIKDLIANGAIVPGGRFPSERALEETIGVSRPVLREAFRVLESWGWIESRRGSGRYLRAPRAAPVLGPGNPLVAVEKSTLLDIWEARQVLETQTAALAAERATPADLTTLKSLVCQNEAALDDQSARSSADLEFHLAIAAATQNFVLRDLVRFQMALLRDMDQRQLLGPDRWQMLCREHARIAAAICRRDATAAADAMAAHLNDLKCAIFEIC